MVGKFLEVGLLLVKLLSQLEELLPLALANGHVLAGLLAARESIPVARRCGQSRSPRETRDVETRDVRQAGRSAPLELGTESSRDARPTLGLRS